MNTYVHLNSDIFQDVPRRQAVANLISRSARELKNLTKQRMVRSQPTGRLYARRGGSGFRRFHRASARGQRPAIDTGKLLNSVQSKTLGEFKAVTAAEAPYAKYLQGERLNRPILSAKDRDEAQIKINRDANAVIASLV